jgi:hypothetical protein
VVGAPFLHVREKMAKNATSKSSVSLSVCLLLGVMMILSIPLALYTTFFLDEEQYIPC